jgi:hypothetical protein
LPPSNPPARRSATTVACQPHRPRHRTVADMSCVCAPEHERDLGTTRAVARAYVSGVRLFEGIDAGVPVRHRPGGLAQQLESLGVQGAGRIGLAQQLISLAPRVPRECVTSPFPSSLNRLVHLGRILCLTTSPIPRTSQKSLRDRPSRVRTATTKATRQTARDNPLLNLAEKICQPQPTRSEGLLRAQLRGESVQGAFASADGVDLPISRYVFQGEGAASLEGDSRS